MHLRQPGLTYSVCGPFTENKEKIQKLKETGDLRYIYQKELDKAYLKFIDFKRTASDEAMHDKAFNIAKNPKYDRNQRDLASMV